MRVTILLALGALAACDTEITPEEKARLDEAAIAEVEAAQIVPPERLEPRGLSFAEFERSDIRGMGCSFVPDGGGPDPVAITRARTAFMKIDNEVERFAADMGSAESALATRVKYDGTRHSLRLQLAEGEGEKAGTDTVGHEARLTVKDGRDRTVYDASGQALCGT
ncbi:hypothetical protein [Qipengyuania sp. MTN3-11]|uniref:hypothetical protein n=1 Tax=Qipengyuania sp. MTN3-11 TaxID=3056557 RepID=UPI0036F28F73